MFVDGQYISPDTWYDAEGKPFQPQVHYYVGGATKMYGAALYRLRPAGLRRDQALRRGLAGLAAGLRRLRAVLHQGRMALSGARQSRRGSDRGPGVEQYPWPPVSHEPRIQQLSDDLAAAGYHPFHAPCGILLDEDDRAASACIRCAWFDGFPCLVHAKSDAEVIAVRPLLGLPNVTLLVDAEVTRLDTDASGRTVTEVVVSRGGQRESYERGHRRASPPAPPTAPRSCSRSATDQPDRASRTARTRLAGTTCSTTARPSSRCPRSRNETVFQKTLGLNDFYLADESSGRSATSRCSASRTLRR